MIDNSKLNSFLGISENIDNDTLLRKIHFKRFKIEFPVNCIEEIEKKFIKTNDIRYFNELLWICDDRKKINKSLKMFNNHFKNGIYEHNYSSIFSNQKYDQLNSNIISLKNNEVALVGNPLFFILPYFKLLKHDIKADIIHIKYHPNKFLNKIFSYLSPFYKIIFRSSYHKINIDNKTQINKIKLPRNYDIGFHKLSFIIKDNIISCFRKGLINDHWGALPFVKGRSTLLYSKLLGVPPIITTHLINRRIDSGKIINYYPLKKKFLKIQIILGLSYRIFDSLNLLSQMKFKGLDNEKGYIFYEMHPWLINKIK